MKKVILVLSIIVVSLLLVFINLNSKKINLEFGSRLEKKDSLFEPSYFDGWIQVQGTNIDMPIIKSQVLIKEDDKNSYAWLGDNEVYDLNRKTIGNHNVLNVTNKPIKDMTNLKDFEGLMAFTYYSFAKENLYIKYTDFNKNEEALYKIYAIGFYDYTDDALIPLSYGNASDEYIKKAKKNSIYDYDVDVNGNDDLIMVFTCTRFFGISEKQQIFIDARKVRDNEKIEKYSVKRNDLNKELGMYD